MLAPDISERSKICSERSKICWSRLIQTSGVPTTPTAVHSAGIVRWKIRSALLATKIACVHQRGFRHTTQGILRDVAKTLGSTTTLRSSPWHILNFSPSYLCASCRLETLGIERKSVKTIYRIWHDKNVDQSSGFR